MDRQILYKGLYLETNLNEMYLNKAGPRDFPLGLPHISHL